MALYREEVLRVTRGSQEGSDGERARGEVEPALRGGGGEGGAFGTPMVVVLGVVRARGTIARLCLALSSVGGPSPGGLGSQQPQPLHTLTRTLYGPLYDPLSAHPLRRLRVRRWERVVACFDRCL